MFTRLLSFEGATDIDAGVRLVRDQVLPILKQQNGFRAVSASADRAGNSLAVLTVWESASDREASESALAKERQQAIDTVGGTLTIEHFEEMVAIVKSPPVPGAKLAVQRVSMDPATVDDNVAFFEASVAPEITAMPGFLGLRNMVDRTRGEGVVGSVWADQQSLEAMIAGQGERRTRAEARGITFGERSLREILFAELG